MRADFILRLRWREFVTRAKYIIKARIANPRQQQPHDDVKLRVSREKCIKTLDLGREKCIFTIAFSREKCVIKTNYSRDKCNNTIYSSRDKCIFVLIFSLEKCVTKQIIVKKNVTKQ